MAPRDAVASARGSAAASPSSAKNNKDNTLSSSPERWNETDSTSVSLPINLFGPMQNVKMPPVLTDKRITRQFIKDQLPARLFERSALRGFMHIFIDLVFVAAFGYGASQIGVVDAFLTTQFGVEKDIAFYAARCVLWPLYWVAQGVVMTGLWVIAHECGHQSFSDSETLNNFVGWVLHSALLVPFHSWRISHRNHHSNTCSVEHDEVFVPFVRSEYTEMIQDTPLYNFFDIMKMLTFGWPGYLIANFSGPAKYHKKANSHFGPNSSLFAERGGEHEGTVLPVTKMQVIWSDLGFFLTIAGVVAGSMKFGFGNVAFYYLIPYLVVNLFLVLITYLQHTDVYIRHYRNKEFTWERGALSTVDRSFGWLIDAAFHHIADTHVVHHLFHTMPFYNAIEATRIVRRSNVLGQYYLRDDTPIQKALWRSWKECRYIDDEGDILEWHNAADLNADLAAAKKETPRSSSSNKKRA